MKEKVYCVVFSEGGKIYYYKSQYLDFAIGDLVIVPVGNNYDEKVVRIVDITELTESQLEFPLKDLKSINRAFNPLTDINPFEENEFQPPNTDFSDEDFKKFVENFGLNNHENFEKLLETSHYFSFINNNPTNNDLNITMNLYRFFASDYNVSRLADLYENPALVAKVYDYASLFRLNYGALYYSGRYVDQSYQMAKHYYMLSAKNLNSQAYTNLGYLYLYGRTGPKDERKAFEYFNKASLLNNVNALYKLGDLFRYGQGTGQDSKMATAMYLRAKEIYESLDFPRESDGANIYKRLGDVYFEGINSEINLQKALSNYCIALPMAFESYSKGDGYIDNLIEKLEIQIDRCKKYMKLMI